MSKIKKVKICERCGKEFLAESGYVHFCDECLLVVKQEKRKRNQMSQTLKKQQELLKGVEGVDYIIDRWSGMPTKRLDNRWIKTYHPGRTLQEYISEFPDVQLVCESTHKKISDMTKERMNTPEWKEWAKERMSGDKNINSKKNTTLEQRQRVSPFSKSFKKYDGMDDEEKMENIRKNLQCDRDDRTTAQIGYWTNKGYTEEEAKELVSERQRTFTLEKCIEKYGEDEGIKVFKERQVKWQNNYKHLNYSKISQELFWEISKQLNETCFFAQNNNGEIDDSGKNHEYKIKTLKSVVSVDFYYPKTNSIIEFDGDYWHSETRKYVNKTRDTERDKSILDVGNYKILHIKECDYKNDKEGTIQKCIDFLLN